MPVEKSATSGEKPQIHHRSVGEIFLQAVQALQGDKTVIIVAHRLSTVEYCDRLYRLDAGRIVDEGTFDEVMNRSQS